MLALTSTLYQSEDVAARAMALSDGGVVAAYDHIGGKHLKAVSIKALRPGGTAVIYGGYDVTKGGKLRIGAALGAGGLSDGAPGLRPHDRVRYYAGFVVDPDGNRIEAVTFPSA